MAKKTEITEEEVKHIASLARIILSQEEIKKYKEQLIRIFDYINQISLMKTKKVIETSHPTNITNIFREDEIDDSKILKQEEALSNAVKKKNGYFLVKAIF